MNLAHKIVEKLTKECKLKDEAQALIYVMTRRQQILEHHTSNVCKIHLGTKGVSKKEYYFTKMTPDDRKHPTMITCNTREGLEDKIVAYYLKIQKEQKITLRNILLKAIDINTGTGARTLQRFDKRLSSLADIPITKLTDKHIKDALSSIIECDVSSKEFNNTVTALNKIADYCLYENIEIIDIKKIVSAFRSVKLRGKHTFKDTTKQSRDVVFDRSEASLIINDAISNPSYRSLAVATLLLTGLRVGELLALEMDDLFLDEDYIWIHHIEETKTFEILNHVKENHSRQVYLSDLAKMVIKMVVDLRSEDENPSPFLFLNENAADGKLHLRAIDVYMREHIHKQLLGYDETREARSPHDCRRTYATLEYLNGTDIKSLKTQLGHSTLSQTEEYIKDIIETAERKNRLMGLGITCPVVSQLKVNPI